MASGLTFILYSVVVMCVSMVADVHRTLVCNTVYNVDFQVHRGFVSVIFLRM
jgi:hypothetical protein